MTDSEDDVDGILLYVKLASNNEIDKALTLAEKNYVPSSYFPVQLPETPKATTQVITPYDDTNENAMAQLVPVSYKLNKKAKGSFPVVAAEQSRREDTLRLPGQRSVESFRAAGLRYLWNFQLNNAKKCFELVKHSDIRSALHWVETNLFRLIVTGRRSEVFKAYDALTAIETSGAHCNDPASEIVVAEIALYKTVLLILSDQRLKAFIALRNAWKTFNKYSEANLQDPDLLCRVFFGQASLSF